MGSDIDPIFGRDLTPQERYALERLIAVHGFLIEPTAERALLLAGRQVARRRFGQDEDGDGL